MQRNKNVDAENEECLGGEGSTKGIEGLAYIV